MYAVPLGFIIDLYHSAWEDQRHRCGNLCHMALPASCGGEEVSSCCGEEVSSCGGEEVSSYGLEEVSSCGGEEVSSCCGE